jgi:hypothetical protein
MGQFISPVILGHLGQHPAGIIDFDGEFHACPTLLPNLGSAT